jgi:DNA-binding MarR family transcriptional regulator
MNNCLFFSTAKLSRVFGKIADEAFLKTGLSPSHAILLYLVNQNGGMMQKELGEALHLTPSTITRLVEKLERRNLLTKKTEGKQAYLNTTQQGLVLQKDIIDSWEQLYQQYDGILTKEETAQFIALNVKLITHMEKE